MVEKILRTFISTVLKCCSTSIAVFQRSTISLAESLSVIFSHVQLVGHRHQFNYTFFEDDVRRDISLLQKAILLNVFLSPMGHLTKEIIPGLSTRLTILCPDA